MTLQEYIEFLLDAVRDEENALTLEVITQETRENYEPIITIGTDQADGNRKITII